LHHSGPIALVVDRELAVEIEALAVGPKEVNSKAVKRADSQKLVRWNDNAARALLLAWHQLADAVAHLARCLVGKRQGQDISRGHSLLQQVANSPGDYPRLATPRTSDNQQRPFQMRDCLPLGGCQIGEQIH